MKKAAARSVPIAERPKPRSTGSLPYGLRELAPLSAPRVFCGMLVMAGERFHLHAAEQTYVLDAGSPFVVDRRLHGQRVSILGYLTEQTLAEEVPAEAIVAMKIVSHEAIARRAYEIHEACREGCAVDNWLRAQRELLEN